MSHAAFEERTARTLGELKDSGTLKRLRHVTGPMGPVVHLEDAGEVIVLCANNYLGLAEHPEVIRAAHEALDRWG